MQTIGEMTPQAIADALRVIVLETTLGKRAGTPTTLQIDVADLPWIAVERLLRYGGQRYVNDDVGGSDTTIEQKVVQARDIIERLRNGDVGRVNAASSVDPLTHEARLIAKATLRKTQPANYKKITAMAPIDAAQALDRIVANNPSLVDAAKESLAEKAAAAKRIAKLEVKTGIDL